MLTLHILGLKRNITASKGSKALCWCRSRLGRSGTKPQRRIATIHDPNAKCVFWLANTRSSRVRTTSENWIKIFKIAGSMAEANKTLWRSGEAWETNSTTNLTTSWLRFGQFPVGEMTAKFGMAVLDWFDSVVDRMNRQESCLWMLNEVIERLSILVV